jgi:hypothetical protein
VNLWQFNTSVATDVKDFYIFVGMKIIFLDIDGVINVISKKRDEFGQLFHPPFVENLKKIIDETGAKIVISSSWRKDGLDRMKEMWKFRNLPGEVIDTTPSIYTGSIVYWNNHLKKHPTPRRYSYSIPRGCEIAFWLERNSELQIENYVILDDDTDMLIQQHGRFVQCSDNIGEEDCQDIGYGLTKSCAEKAISILNSK